MLQQKRYLKIYQVSRGFGMNFTKMQNKLVILIFAISEWEERKEWNLLHRILHQHFKRRLSDLAMCS